MPNYLGVTQACPERIAETIVFILYGSCAYLGRPFPDGVCKTAVCMA